MVVRKGVWFFLVVPFLALTLTSGVSAQTNALVNGSFEDGFTGWSVSNSAMVIRSGGLDGDYSYLGSDTQSLGCKVSQTVNLTPGRYQINLSFYYRAECDGHCDEMISPLGILAEVFFPDGAYDEYYDEIGSMNWYDHPWYRLQTFGYEGVVNGPIDVQIRMGTGHVVEHDWYGEKHYYGAIGLDKVVLSVTPIPEPASFVGLLVGFFGLVGRRIRLHRRF